MNETARLTPERIENLAIEIREFLLEHEMWVDVDTTSQVPPLSPAEFSFLQTSLYTLPSIAPPKCNNS